MGHKLNCLLAILLFASALLAKPLPSNATDTDIKPPINLITPVDQSDVSRLEIGSYDSLNELIANEPLCSDANDGCTMCKINEGDLICSTPGIACMAKNWVCVN